MPRTDVPLLKIAVVVLCAVWIVLGARLAYVFGFGVISAVLAVALIALALGLWQLRPIARSVSKFLLGCLVVVDLLGTFGPFYGLDHSAAKYGDEVSWGSILAVHIPLLAVAIALFGILDRYKQCFPPRASPPGPENAA